MSDFVMPSWIDDPAFTLKVGVVAPDGTRSKAKITIHRARVAIDNGDFAGGLEVEGIGRPYDGRRPVIGVDSWQVLNLSLSSLQSMLEHRSEQGFVFEWCDAPVGVSHLMHGRIEGPNI